MISWWQHTFWTEGGRSGRAQPTGSRGIWCVIDICLGSVKEGEVMFPRSPWTCICACSKLTSLNGVLFNSLLSLCDWQNSCYLPVYPAFFCLLSWVCSLLAKNKRLHSIQLYSFLYRAQSRRIYDLHFWQEETLHDRILNWKMVLEG